MHFQASLMAAATLAGLASAIPPPVGTSTAPAVNPVSTPANIMNPGAKVHLKVDKEHKCQIELVKVGQQKLSGEVKATGGFGTFDPHHKKCHSNSTVVVAPGWLHSAETSGGGAQATGGEATLALFFQHEEGHNANSVAHKKGDLSISASNARYNIPLGLVPGEIVYNGTDWVHTPPHGANPPPHPSSHPNVPYTTQWTTPRIPAATPNAQ